MEHTVTRAILCARAAEVTGMAQQDVSAISERMFELMGEALMEGKTVKLTGFCSLQVRSRAERVGRNPRTGQEHRIAPHHTVVLVPSGKLRDVLEQPPLQHADAAE